MTGTKISATLMRERTHKGRKFYDNVYSLGVFDAEVGAALNSSGALISLPTTLGSLIPTGGSYGSNFYVEFTPVQWPSRAVRAPKSGLFTVLDVPTPPLELTITAPAFGSSFTPGSSINVAWSVSSVAQLLAQTEDSDAQGSLVLGTCAASPGGGSLSFSSVSVLTSSASIAGATNFQATLPVSLLPRGDYCVRIVMATTTAVSATSAAFTVTMPPSIPGSISVSSPRAGTVCTLGSPCSLSWSATGVSPNLVISLVQTIGGASTTIPVVSSSDVGSILGIFSFTLPANESSLFPGDLNAPFQFSAYDAASPTVTGLSPDFTITRATPPLPPLTLIAPSSISEWVVGANVSGASFVVSWSSNLIPSSDPASEKVTILLQYREESVAGATTLLAPISWTTVVVKAGAAAAAGVSNVTLPSAVPVNVQGLLGATPYLYRIKIVWELDNSVFTEGDAFKIVATPASPGGGGGGGGTPVTPDLPSDSASPSALASPSPSTSVAPIIVPADPSPTPMPPPLLIKLSIVEPASAAVLTMGDTVFVRWILNSSRPVAFSSWSLSLYRRLESGNVQWVFDPIAVTPGEPPAFSSLRWVLSPSTFPANILYTSGYILRLEMSTVTNETVTADSGSFTLAPLLALAVESPLQEADVTEGSNFSVSWISFGIDGDVSLTMVNSKNEALTPLLAERVPIVNSPSDVGGQKSFIFPVSTTWGSFEPLSIRIVSLTRPDFTAKSASFRVIALPPVIRVVSLVTSAAAVSYGASQSAIVTWTTSGNVGTAGAIDLVCTNATGSQDVIETASSDLSLGTYTWSFSSREPLRFRQASLCTIRVRSTISALTAGSSQPFSLAPAALPSLSLLLPAPSTNGQTLQVSPGDLLPLRWLPKLATGLLTATLNAVNGGAMPETLIGDSSAVSVSTLSLPSFVVPLTVAANAYSLELSAVSSVDQTILSTTPFAVNVVPPPFSFTSPTPLLVAVAGTTVSVSFSNPASWCSSVKVDIELFTQAPMAADPLSLGPLSPPGGVSSCAGAFSLPLPVSILSGDYFLKAHSLDMPALAAVSPAFRVAPAPAQQYIGVDCPAKGVTAGGSLPIYFNASGFSTVSSFNIFLIQCDAGAQYSGSSSFTGNESAVSKISGANCQVYTVAQDVQAISVYQWAIPTTINNFAFNAASVSFFSIVWAADASMVIQGISCPFSIAPAPPTSITSVTTSIVGGVLDAAASSDVYVSWTRLGPSTTYRVELWQERFYYAGGDIKLLDITPTPVYALDGAYAFVWSGVSTQLPSTEPVYLRVVATAGPFAGSWGRSDMFTLRSSPLPGFFELQSAYCPRLGSVSPDAALDNATWSALCATDCSSCSAVNGSWAPGASVELKFDIPQVSRSVTTTAGTVELSRLTNTLGAFTQTVSICVPAASVAAGAASSTYAALIVPLGATSVMNASIEALKPRNITAAWPHLEMQLAVTANQLASSCASIQPLVETTISVTVDSSSTSTLVSDVTTAFSGLTSLPSFSFSVTLDTAALAAELARAAQEEADAAALAAANAAAIAAAGGYGGDDRRRRLGATSADASTRLLELGGARLLAAHSANSRFRRASSYLSAETEARVLAGAMGLQMHEANSRRLGASIAPLYPYELGAISPPAVVPRGVSPLDMHFSNARPGVVRNLLEHTWRALGGSAATNTGTKVSVFLRVSASATSSAAAASLRAVIESNAAAFASGISGRKNATRGRLLQGIDATVLSTQIVPSQSLASINGSASAASQGTAPTLTETRAKAGVGNGSLTSSSYDDDRANSLRASSQSRAAAAWSSFKAFLYSFGRFGYSLAAAILTDKRFYAFISLGVIVAYVIGKYFDQKARSKWLKDVATGKVVVPGGHYDATSVRKSGTSPGDVADAIPAEVPMAGLGHTGRSDLLWYVRVYASVRAFYVHIFHKGAVPHIIDMNPINRSSFSDSASIVVNPLAPFSESKSPSYDIATAQSKRFMVGSIQPRVGHSPSSQHYNQSPSEVLASVTALSEGPIGRGLRTAAGRSSVAKTLSPTISQ
jgi:hypothetical protein